MYYTIVDNNILTSEQEETLAAYYDNVKEAPDDFEYGKYIIVDGDIALNPDFEKEQEEAEKRFIQSLTMTKRVFALALRELGISYQQLKELIAKNEQAQLEWELCERLQRSNPLLDIMAKEVNITSEQLDEIFIRANIDIIKSQYPNILEILTPAEALDADAD